MKETTQERADRIAAVEDRLRNGRIVASEPIIGSRDMPLPSVQSLLLPTLLLVANGHSVEEMRERLKQQFDVVGLGASGRMYPKSGRNIFVNSVAWALAHLVMGKLIELDGTGRYRITERGKSVLKGNPSELAIGDLH